MIWKSKCLVNGVVASGWLLSLSCLAASSSEAVFRDGLKNIRSESARGASRSYADESQKPPKERAYARDRKMDIEHLALDIIPDFEKRKIKGRMTLTFHPIAKAMDELKLDAVDLGISKVSASVPIASYEVLAKEITINFAQPIAADKTATITIDYTAQPLKGLYFRVPSNGYPAGDTQLFSQGETEESRHWFPCFDAPNEKFTSELTCSVPDGMIVISNGKQISCESDAATKLTKFHWLQDKPHANYLVTLVAGKFTTLKDQYKNIPLSFYTPPSDSKEAPLAFSFTKPIMEFFENRIQVPFPWSKYGQVIVKDFHYGGMENTSITTLSESFTLQPAAYEQIYESEDYISAEQIIAHEMAHQWFGDLITCKDWGNVWLNEGFATYYTLLYTGHKYGESEMLYGFWKDREKVVQTNDWRPIIFRQYENSLEQIDQRVYEKGSLVLRMLNRQIGDQIYTQAVKKYLETNGFKNVVTQDFNAITEELSGRSLDRFFDQWVYRSGIPELEVSYSWTEKTKLAKISVRQKQKIEENSPAFRFPLEVRFKLKDKTINETLDVTRPEEDFYVSLPAAPSAVLVDPEVSLLAKIQFSPGNNMLLTQLKDETETMGRVSAAQALSEFRDDESIKGLKSALNDDKFIGVRMECAKSLAKIHNNEALEALIASVKQSNPRVRKCVMESLGKFYNPRALDGLLKGLDSEQNPAIQSAIIAQLGSYHTTQVQEVLRKFLKQNSYRQIIALGCFDAIKESDDPVYVPDIKQFLAQPADSLDSTAVSNALSTIAYISRNEKPRDDVREFITGYLASNNERIQSGAIHALGKLEDPKSISVLRPFAAESNDTPQKRDAEYALQRIRESNKPNDNLKDLRDEVVELQKQNADLKKDLDDLKKRLKIDEDPKTRRRASSSSQSAKEDVKEEKSSKSNKDSKAGTDSKAGKEQDSKAERESSNTPSKGPN